MIKLEVTEQQLNTIQQALDFFSRVGAGQFSEILHHPTFEKHLWKELYEKEGSEKWSQQTNIAENLLYQARNMLYNDLSFTKNGHWGINHENVDESCREAYDLVQKIRFEKRNGRPEKDKGMGVDSSCHFTTEDGHKIKIEL